MAWEKSERWPSDPVADPFRSAPPEPIVAERGAPGFIERAARWLLEGPGESHFAPQRFALTERYLYIDAGTLLRTPREAIQGAAIYGAELIIAIADGEDIIVPRTPNCPVEAALVEEGRAGEQESVQGHLLGLWWVVFSIVMALAGSGLLSLHLRSFNSLIAEYGTMMLTSETAYWVYFALTLFLVPLILISLHPRRATVGIFGVVQKRGLFRSRRYIPREEIREVEYLPSLTKVNLSVESVVYRDGKIPLSKVKTVDIRAREKDTPGRIAARLLEVEFVKGEFPRPKRRR